MTYEFGDKSKPQIVMIHGFMGSAMVFFKLFKHLSERYHVIMIDLLGMGASSRPEFLARTKVEAEDFYMQSIEKWRQKMGIERMNLIGHSFGGYLATRYSLRYPSKVNKLILWSPHGCEPKPEKYDELLRQRRRESCKFNCFIGMMLCIFRNELKPYILLRCCAKCLGPCLIKRFIKRRLSSLSDKEKAIIYRYFYQITMIQNSGEKAIFKLMEQPILAFTPLFNDLEDLTSNNIDVSFVYGDLDWIDTDMSDTRISRKLIEAGYNVKYVKDSDHHLYFDNPEGLLETLDETMLA